MHTNSLSFRYNMLAICVLGAMQPLTAFASTTSDDDTTKKAATVVLDEIVVVLDKNTQNQSTSSTVKTAKELSKQMVADSRDLVRYETGVTVVETGRFGASGYAIRGVDENRVAINIDGLRQAETLSSQGFKELFEGYGNFNNTRNSVEIENLKRATIKKGADSVASGSGALGGAVLFDTKEAQDYLNQKDWHVGYKTGYASANNQKFGSLTLAGKAGNFDALLVATRRDGHELENWGYKKYDGRIQGRKREKTDPYHIEQNSTLLKLGYTVNDDHQFGISFDDTKRQSRGHDFSYTLKFSPYQELDEVELRHTNDESNRRAISLFYTNNTPNPLWDEATIRFTKQDITTKARTDDYCDGDEKCNTLSNSLGLQLKDGKVVDKNGNPLIVEADKDGKAQLRANGQIYKNFGNRRVDGFWFDCQLFDCNSPIDAYEAKYGSLQQTLKLELDRKYTDPATGKTYATTSKFSPNILMPFPESKGYLDNLYSDRDLNTDTKQLDLGFKKFLSLSGLSHQLAYGAQYSETEKSMVNKTGSNAWAATWWADRFLGLSLSDMPRTCQNFSSFNSYLCPSESVYSFLIPVKTKDGSFYLNDKLTINDRLTVDIGYRYNRIKYQPNYIVGQTPKIPDDMVKGLFIPQIPEPKYWDYQGGVNNPQYQADKKRYDENAAQNIAYISQPKKYSKHSYALASAFDVTNHIRAQAKYSQGFRMPTIDEMYFTFRHPDITIKPNVNLKPEIAKTKELSLTAYGDYGFVTGSVFRTDYKDFIDFIFKGNEAIEKNSSRKWPIYQSVNRQDAKVDGFEINSQLNVGHLISNLKGLNVSYKYTHQKGKADGDIPMNAIQPHTSVFGVGYDAPNGRAGGNFYLTHVAAKKAQDTYNIFWKEENATDSAIKWRSDAYTVLDLTSYYKPTKNITLQAGIYNLTNRKYLTWDSARSIRSFGTSNMIDKATGQGIHRFYAPGRNFKLSAEFVF